jgi:hypothetical protein
MTHQRQSLMCRFFLFLLLTSGCFCPPHTDSYCQTMCPGQQDDIDLTCFIQCKMVQQ